MNVILLLGWYVLKRRNKAVKKGSARRKGSSELEGSKKVRCHSANMYVIDTDMHDLDQVFHGGSPEDISYLRAKEATLKQ